MKGSGRGTRHIPLVQVYPISFFSTDSTVQTLSAGGDAPAATESLPDSFSDMGSPGIELLSESKAIDYMACPTPLLDESMACPIPSPVCDTLATETRLGSLYKAALDSIPHKNNLPVIVKVSARSGEVVPNSGDIIHENSKVDMAGSENANSKGDNTYTDENTITTDNTMSGVEVNNDSDILPNYNLCNPAVMPYSPSDPSLHDATVPLVQNLPQKPVGVPRCPPPRR